RGGEMDMWSGRAIEIAPFHSRGSLKGFVVSGRWPDSTKEGAQLLIVAVRIASLPGLLSTTTIFGAREELPEEPVPGTVGLVGAEGTVFGESAVPPGHFAGHQPPALLMLHPPSETMPSLPECTGDASGCELLPGIPQLGIEYGAAGGSRSGSRAPRRVGGGGGGWHRDVDGKPRGYRSDQPPRHRYLGHAAC